MRKEISLTVFAVIATAVARLAWGQTSTCGPGQPSNGNLCLVEAAISAGGGCLQQDTVNYTSCTIPSGQKFVPGLMLNYVMNNFSQPMTGGALKIVTGIVAYTLPAAPDVTAAHAFPTPFVPSQGHTSITFTALPAAVTIKIFTISGHLVKTLTKSDSSDSLIWSPVANEQGSPLASGVYIFIITQTGGTQKKGKIMIIR